MTFCGGEHWSLLPPMCDSQYWFACEAMARCVMYRRRRVSSISTRISRGFSFASEYTTTVIKSCSQAFVGRYSLQRHAHGAVTPPPPCKQRAGPSTAPSPSSKCGPSSPAFSGLVGAWRLLAVCKAARAGAKEFLGTLPRLVVCGGCSWDGGGVCERGVGARSSDDTVGGYACSCVLTLRPRVLRSEGRPRRPGGVGPTRWDTPS